MHLSVGKWLSLLCLFTITSSYRLERSYYVDSVEFNLRVHISIQEEIVVSVDNQEEPTVYRKESPSEAVDSDSPVHQNRQTRKSEFTLDRQGNPTGGVSIGEGYTIAWQNGVQNPNGAILEDVIATCVDRLEFFQAGRFSCRENALAITHLQEALHWLNHRTVQRRRRGVEGSYEV